MIFYYLDASAWVKRYYVEDDQLIFVTSDHELKEAAQASGLTAIDPDEKEQ